MSILNKLATSLNRRDENPNIKLAVEIATNLNHIAVKELVINLQNKSKDIQHDCIKVLYEVGNFKPSLIVEYLPEFLKLLQHKNNRLQWGAMIALHKIAIEKPDLIYKVLPIILAAAAKGSVITNDYAVNILIALCAVKKYADAVFHLLMEQLLICPTNQLPMYAERAMPIINLDNKIRFIDVLNQRLGEIEKETKRKRVEKLIKKLK